MNLRFWKKKETEKQEKKTERKEEIDRYIMIRVCGTPGALGAISVSCPTPTTMRSYLDELDHINKIDINDEFHYVPIGVLYEAIRKPKKEENNVSEVE